MALLRKKNVVRDFVLKLNERTVRSLGGVGDLKHRDWVALGECSFGSHGPGLCLHGEHLVDVGPLV